MNYHASYRVRYTNATKNRAYGHKRYVRWESAISAAKRLASTYPSVWIEKFYMGDRSCAAGWRFAVKVKP